MSKRDRPAKRDREARVLRAGRYEALMLPEGEHGWRIESVSALQVTAPTASKLRIELVDYISLCQSLSEALLEQAQREAAEQLEETEP